VSDFRGGGGVLAIEEGAEYIQSQLRYGQVYVRSVPSYHFFITQKSTLEHRYIARLEEAGVL
jgi:hypothetical protein